MGGSAPGESNGPAKGRQKGLDMANETLLSVDKLNELRDIIVDGNDQFIKGGRMLLKHAVAIGHALRDAKLGIKYGSFEEWVRVSCKMRNRTARVYMQIAQKTDLEEFTSSMLLNTTIQKALEATPDDEGDGKKKPKKDKRGKAPVPVVATRKRDPKPEDVKTALTTGAARFEVYLNEIQALRRNVKKLSGTRLCGEYLPLGEIDAALRTALSILKFARPHSRCVHCPMRDDRQRGDCTACGGRGWISRCLYDTAPDSLKKLVKDARK